MGSTAAQQPVLPKSGKFVPKKGGFQEILEWQKSNVGINSLLKQCLSNVNIPYHPL